MYKKIDQCRVCANKKLVQVVDLGEQYLTGVFPKTKDHSALTKGPLRLVKCDGGTEVCGLLQLEHSYDLKEMYGDNYGYRSGLNPSMVKHLHGKVQRILKYTSLNKGDMVIDIGSNDGTTLGAYPENLDLIGVDPTGKKFRKYYKPHVNLIPDFFSYANVHEFRPDKKAKVITSFSMLYDLEDPVGFAVQVAEVLDKKDGVWIFEQSYMPTMLQNLAYDTICHEHIEYYGLAQIKWIADRANLKILDVELNDVNGGSFSVMAAHKESVHDSNDREINRLLGLEIQAGLNGLSPFHNFFSEIKASRKQLVEFVGEAKRNGKKVFGLGASTKGNVVLQYCGFTEDDILGVGEVNPDKFGAYTPGSAIPIIDEKSILDGEQSYLLVLPWHFKSFFTANNIFKKHKLVFPLPKLEVI